MSERFLVIDTETTGLSRRHDRIVEIGVVEVVDGRITGAEWHSYMSPEGRKVDRTALKVHGLSDRFLVSQPTFSERLREFAGFVSGATLVAHNAGFDRGMLNAELARCGQREMPRERWIDTLPLARKRWPGMAASLDAVADRLKVSRAARSERHGALVDARILAACFVEMQWPAQAGLDVAAASSPPDNSAPQECPHPPQHRRPRPLVPRLTADDMERHRAFVRDDLGPDSIWAKIYADRGEPISFAREAAQ